MSTKLGPHVLRSTPDPSGYIQAGIPLVKVAGVWGIASDVSEGVLVIGRLVADYDAQHQKAMGQTPLEAARQFVQDQLLGYQSNPHIVYWEGHNEPVWTDEEGMRWYAQFEVERMQLPPARRIWLSGRPSCPRSRSPGSTRPSWVSTSTAGRGCGG